MLEGIVADVLVRVLGSYVDGLNRESIRVGVWQGDLELHNLRLRPDALAILFETLGLDLPVTVTAGYIGLLRLEVPWKLLRSAPVRIFMRDLTVVASPVSDGDQSALELREQRLKSARLATDEAVRDAKFSVRTAFNRSSTSQPNSGQNSETDPAGQPTSGNRVTRWGWRFTSRVVTRIVDNMQIDVENVIIQYEDSSSVRDKPYTATLAFDSLRACSTDRNWNRVFIENPDSPIVHKVVYARGLVLNWQPGASNNELRSWILDSNSVRTSGQWAGLARSQTRHAIRPMDGELRIALTKNSALASAIAGGDASLHELRNIPRVQMDLHFPQVHIGLDDFQYHTLLSTIMYLSDIDRKVRPKTARGRWYWALDRLLPRFKERRQAAQNFTATGLRNRREKREQYCRARNAVVNARRGGLAEPTEYAKAVEELENEFSYNDIMHFRDLADRELLSAQLNESSTTTPQPNSRFWSLFSRRAQTGAELSNKDSSGSETEPSENVNETLSSEILNPSQNASGFDSADDQEADKTSNQSAQSAETNNNVPKFRMGFLLGRGAIELKEGGFRENPIPISSLEFRELRLGISTRPTAGLLLEALLGTFEVIDLQKDLKVMYPRVPWAGDKVNEWDNPDEDHKPESTSNSEARTSMSQLADEWLQEKQLGNTSNPSDNIADNNSSPLVPILHSYPHEISDAIAEIRGEYGVESTTHPLTSPRFSPYRSSMTSESSSSVSGMSDCGTSAASPFTREDLSVSTSTPLRYIAALRLNQEEATGDWASGATRMAMDLAIGGMEVLIDGSNSAFISSVTFWHPREKMPSIMQFLMKAAAPRLASLRMNIQKALLERSVPMRMDLLIRGPRFVIPGSAEDESSLVLDLGTFAMETSTSVPEVVSHEDLLQQSPHSETDAIVSELEKDALSIRYTEYKMAFTDLGVYVVSEAGGHAAERIVRPFSVHLLLEVLHNASFIEAMTLSYGKVSISRVKLRGKLPSLRTSVSHHAFRQILEAIKTWEESSKEVRKASGIEPNPVTNSLSMSAEMEKVRRSHDESIKTTSTSNVFLDQVSSPLIAFQMMLDFEDLQLELRDSLARRIVTISSSGTQILLTRRPESIDFDYRVRTFTVTDGSRGATAPFRRLAYAGTNSSHSPTKRQHNSIHSSNNHPDGCAFITLSYHGDLVNQEQELAVKILSLNLVCVRESYFALADFFYLKDRRKAPEGSKQITAEQKESIEGLDGSTPDDDGAEYVDPFAAVGMTTSGAAHALRQQAGRGMQISKQAIANRGRISVKADLDGLNLTLVTAEGAIASFDVTDCKIHLVQEPNGSINASGGLGGFGVRDLTSAFDVYSETIRYRQTQGENQNSEAETDGWKLKMPPTGTGDIDFHAYLRNIRIVYLHRFIIILKKYFDVLRESLRPILEMKGGLGEVFEAEHGEDFPSLPKLENRVNVSIITERIDIVMPRHSQSPYEALRFFVPRSSISNVGIAAPGYQIGLQVQAEDVDTYVLYQKPAEGEGRALTKGGTDPVLKHISPNTPIENLTPFSTNVSIIAKLDLWRRRRVPEVVLNADGLPVLKHGEEEREYDPAKWLPAIRVRISAPNGISARLCEAEYSILYFTFTENVIERPDIEFTDIVRGLKTPVLPARRPVQPIMFSSNKMPPNYQIIFEVPQIDSVIMSGADPKDDSATLIRTQLTDLLGSFDYGVDYRMTIEVNANLMSLVDIRPGVPSHGKTLITKTKRTNDPSGSESDLNNTGMTRSVTFTWDRPFGFRSNIMVVASDMKIIVEPELFRDLGALTTPGFPFLKSSAPPPLLRFNGRLMIVTVSRPEIWVMANQFPGDGRCLVLRGDIIAKVRWAAVTGRQMVEIAANGIHVNLSNVGPSFDLASGSQSSPRSTDRPRGPFSLPRTRKDTETPMLYPCDISMRYDGSGYDPPEKADGDPVKISGSSLSINAESFLVRIDVNDTPLILAVGSRLVRLKPSELSRRPLQPGRFDQWIDKGEEGDAKLAVDFSLPNSRLMFTDETAGRYVPIMEARIRNAVVKSNVPWLTNLSLEFGLDLFNDEKGWWEPGIEMFPVQLAASQGRSGSRAIHIRAEKNIDINVTPNTVSGAARVLKALKSAIMDLTSRLHQEKKGVDPSMTKLAAPSPTDIQTSLDAKRPSVAAFCVRNETGRSMFLWLPYDSKRRPLQGSGGEIEVDTPSEELLWTAIGADGLSSTNPNKNRQVSLSCILCLSGYVPKTFSTAQTGTWLVTMKPDMREISSLVNEDQPDATTLTLVWSVAMRDGVPCGCIRSVLRIVNCTRTVLEVSVGGLSKSTSVGSALKYSRSNQSEASNYESEAQLEHEPYGLVKAGESWSIPIHSIHRAIRVRPAIFHAPEADLAGDNDSIDSTARSRVFYTYKWSDPLSKISALHQIGNELRHTFKNGDGSSSKSSGPSLSGPALTCRADDRKHVFTMTLRPQISRSMDSQKIYNKDVPGWVDVHICAPLVFENLLPRPLYFKLGLPGNAKRLHQEQVLAEYYVEPLREAHIHTVGSNLSNVAIAIGVDNKTVNQNSPLDGSRLALAHSVGDFLPKLPSLVNISMGSGRYSPFTLKFDHEKSASSRTIRAYCEFWIRNRSDIDLFFRDRDNTRDAKEYSSPKVFLRGRPPGVKADKYVCFSGKWLAFQRADATEDIWVNVATEVPEIDKPMHIKFEGLSLLLDVRPAKGRLQRSLVVTIRNAVWLENRTGTMLQWCQPAALNAHGIALTSRVHTVKPGEVTALHWDFSSRRKAICLRRANEDGSSEWIWSRPVNVQGVEGEFVAKMYRPKRHEQYIARVLISMLKYGVRGVVVHREDRNTPPYRIVNNCTNRSIAFRQSGVHETHPWLVRPGNSTRYSWDDPQAPVKKRSLVVEVIEALSRKETKTTVQTPGENSDTSGSPPESSNSHTKPKKEKEIRYPKFDLNIDLITGHVPFANSNRFNPPLIVSVHVDGPTKVVTFGDGVLGEISPRPGAGRSTHIAGTSAQELSREKYTRTLDVELFINAIGVSFVDSSPTELAYLSITGVHFRLDRFDGQQLVICEIEDLQLDNQVVKCPWPVVLWSPPPIDSGSGASSSGEPRRAMPKPFFQLTIDGPYPSISHGIGNFRGIFVALQELQIAADEDFVLRLWLFVVSLIEAAGGSHDDKEESLTGKDGFETDLRLSPGEDVDSSDADSVVSSESRTNRSLKRLYIEHLELCPLKLTVSFTSSRTSKAAERIGGFRSLMRTLVAVLGNVENAEFRFNALELHHMFDSVSHFRSLITEFYVSQGSNQKMVLLASNSLIGNPSALFDSIAIGTRDFFVEPANAKGSADFIASIGRGSSSLLTNTVGGLVGSIGAIPRAMAQGLETAVGDRDYLAERDSIRGGRARIVSSPAQGLVTGALSFGHGIASAAAGLIRDPIQGAAEEGASGFIKGLGKGFIGGVLKPITGALDLIAEPAAGFRSMMVSDRNREFAEPARPPRAFWGAHGNQMTSYDLRAALGQSILEAVNGSESSADGERIVSWTHLVAVHHNASDEQVIGFLWALMRRSARSTLHFQTKYLLDAQGNPQRAEKMRAGLITTKRLIITSIDGHVLWEYPLVDIVDSHVSLEAKDYLMVGVRPIGYNSRLAIAPNWKKIHCGSMAARNEMNTSLGKAIQEQRIATETFMGTNTLYPSIVGGNGNRRGSKYSRNTLNDRKVADSSLNDESDATDASLVEMVDLSNAGGMNESNGDGVELKSLNHDASVDGRRGVFTNMKLPGRESKDGKPIISVPLEENGNMSSHTENQDQKATNGMKTKQASKEVQKALEEAAMLRQGPKYKLGLRSVCIFVLNELDESVVLKRAHMESGRWACELPRAIPAHCFVKLEMDSGNDRVKDILGWIELSHETTKTDETASSAANSSNDRSSNDLTDDVCAIRFVNPMLAANAYAVKNASWMTGSFKGGEKGDHVVTTLTLRKVDEAKSTREAAARADIMANEKRKKSTVEPLLFGRSKVAPLPSKIEPPHAPKKQQADPEDPDLIEKLSSLGFTEDEARMALKRSDADLSAAYAKLVEMKSAIEP